MAPELFTVLDNDNLRGARITKATDVYSFGLLGFEATDFLRTLLDGDSSTVFFRSIPRSGRNEDRRPQS
jgi:serine/threonine protein kinase